MHYFILYEVYVGGQLITKSSFNTKIEIDPLGPDPSEVMANIHSHVWDRERTNDNTDFEVLILNIINLNSLFNI